MNDILGSATSATRKRAEEPRATGTKMRAAVKDSTIAASVMAVLRCIKCQGRLNEGEEAIQCTQCGASYPRVNGIVRFVDSSNYADSFGFQWQFYSKTQLDTQSCRESEIAFTRRTGLTPDQMSGKLVLDVGCGMGRFAEVASRNGGRVVGIDLSLASEVAARNLAQRENVTIFQADVFSLPFAPESFDYIYSIGVLHHTPDCEAAFKALPRLLKPGGTIGIWLYSGYNKWYRMSDLYRKVTTRLPKRLLHALCYGVVPLHYVDRALGSIPWIGKSMSAAFRYVIPMSTYGNRHWRVLDTFDWYSPRYQSKHTYEEVFRWMEDCGLDHMRVMHDPIGVQARKP